VLCVYFPFIFSFHIRWLPSFPTRRSSDLQPNGNYVVNGLNQYTQRNGVNFEYDDSGNLTFDGTTRFLYDQENRLVKATNSNGTRSEEHTSELQSRENLVCRLLLEKKNKSP